MYTLEDVSSFANFITAYEKSQQNRDSHFLIRSVFFVSKSNLVDAFFTIRHRWIIQNTMFTFLCEC